MTASLREAAQLALDALRMPCDRWSGVQAKIVSGAIEALHAALALPDEPDKLQQIIACAYQIAGAYDAPEHVLDVLANPLDATQAQIDALLPFGVPDEPWVDGRALDLLNATQNEYARVETCLWKSAQDGCVRIYAAPQPAEPKALKLYGWQVAGTRDLHTGDFAETNAKAEAKHIGGHAFPLYTVPQPGHAEVAPDMVRQPLPEKQKREIWAAANTRHMTAMQLFLEGFEAAELAHGIKAAE